jgi:hypothetical protein
LLAEPSRLHASLDLPIVAHRQFILEDQFQELLMVEMIACRFLQAHLQCLGQARQA